MSQIFTSELWRFSLKKISSSTWGVYLFFLIISLLGYYQIGFLKYSLQWDMIDAYLPWRYQITDLIQNKHLPFWNPYQRFGYPIFGDLRTVFNPEYNLIGLGWRYNIVMLQLIFIFYISIAGLAMFRLALYLNIKRVFAICAGICLIFSGYFVSEGQEMTTYPGTACVLFTLYYILKLLDRNEIQYVFKASLALFLTVVFAYPGVTIILIYFLATLIIIKLIEIAQLKRTSELKKNLWQFTLLAGIVLSLCSFYIISLKLMVGNVDRFSGISADQLNIYPFTPPSLISLLFPYSTIKEQWFGTVNVMNNIYIGTVTIAFLFLTFFRKLNKTEIVMLCLALVSLWAAFGTGFKMRLWLSHLPLMDLFNCPSFFRPFVIIPLLLAAFRTASEINTSPNLHKRLIQILLGFIILYSIILVAIGFRGIPTGEITFNTIFQNIFFKEFVGYKLHIFIQAAILLVILIVSWIILRITRQKTSSTFWIILFSVDMFISAQLNIPYTVACTSSPKISLNYFSKVPKTSPIPECIPVKMTSDRYSENSGMWINTNNLTKIPSNSAFNSFTISKLGILENNYETFRDSLYKNQLLYFSDSLKNESELKANPKHVKKTDVFASETDFKTLNKLKLKATKGDTLYFTLFKPNEIELVAKTGKSRFVNVLQTWFNGWHLYIDGKPATMYQVNLLFRGFTTLPGMHTYTMKFELQYLKVSFFITYLLLIILIITIAILEFFKHKKLAIIVILGISIAILSSLIILYLFNKTAEQNQDYLFRKFSSELSNRKQSDLFILNTDNNRLIMCDLNSKTKPAIVATRVENYFALSKLQTMLDSISVKHSNCALISSGVLMMNELNKVVQQHFPKIDSTIRNNGGEIIYYSKSKSKNTFILVENTDFKKSDRFVSLISVQYSDSQKYLKLDSIYAYSPGFKFPYYNLGITNPELSFEITFKNTQPGNRCHLVVSHKRGRRELETRYFNLFAYSNLHKNFDKGIFVYKPVHNFLKNDGISIYVWNEGGQELLIKNVRIELGKQ